jgi:hypothetical protein
MSTAAEVRLHHKFPSERHIVTRASFQKPKDVMSFVALEYLPRQQHTGGFPGVMSERFN